MSGCRFTNDMKGSPFLAGYLFTRLASSGRRLTQDAVPFRSGLGWAGFFHAYLGAGATGTSGASVTSPSAPLGCGLFRPLLRMYPTHMAATTAPTTISIP